MEGTGLSSICLYIPIRSSVLPRHQRSPIQQRSGSSQEQRKQCSKQIWFVIRWNIPLQEVLSFSVTLFNLALDLPPLIHDMLAAPGVARTRTGQGGGGGGMFPVSCMAAVCFVFTCNQALAGRVFVRILVRGRGNYGARGGGGVVETEGWRYLVG